MGDTTSSDAGRLALVAREQAITRVTLNRPASFNALTNEMIQELQAAFAALADDTEARVVIVEGAGGNFCAGADIALFLAETTEAESYTLLQDIKRLVETMRAIPQPLVCKLEGVAYGGGANLALACDIVLAAENARFCEVFSTLGLTLDAGGTYSLPRLVGLSRARALALLGTEIDGRAAAEMGLIYKATPVEALEGEVVALAGALAKKSPRALTAIKHGLDASFNMTMSEALEWEAKRQAELLHTPELKAAAQRFLESRGKKTSQ